MTCYCRGAAVCGHCGKHSCTDCQCDDIDQKKEDPMSWEPIDDLPEGQWIVYGETGAVIGTFGQDEYRAKEAARACGGRDRGIAAVYKEQPR